MRTPILLITIIVALSSRSGGGLADEIDFNRDIRPILSDKCFRCHGPDSGERQTSMRLDRRDSALAPLDGGGRAIVPGDPEASELLRRIVSDDESLRMPPPETGKRVSADERERLRRWIEAGATWSEHWAFVAPQRPALPPVTQTAWPRNPIDHFVLARLEQVGLGPNPEADRATLIRRVTLDLTGLPPTPAEVDAFCADRAPDAYERLVDRLLHSPRYGEHRARHWLDVARYGDTHGLHLDNQRSIWPYRDWLIDAFNRNQPFDQFTVEQLAGDLLPDPTLAQRVATGFNRCNVTTSEGGSIDEEYLVRYAVDRVETTATAWMGLTAGCAACHDHKFDPISQREFYQMFAYFFSLTERPMDGNALLPPPAVKVPTRWQRVKQQRMREELDELNERVGARRRAAQQQLDTWTESYLRDRPAPAIPQDTLLYFPLDTGQSEDQPQVVPFQSSVDERSSAVVQGNAAWDAGRIGGGLRFDGETVVEVGDSAGFERDQPFTLAAWVYLDGDGAMTIVSRMDDANAHRGYDFYLGEGRLFVHLIHRWPDSAVRVNTAQPIARQKWHHVACTYDGTSRAEGVTIFVDGVPQALERTHDSLGDSILTDQPLRLGRRQTAAPLRGILDDLRIYARALATEEITALAKIDPIQQILAINADERSPLQQTTLLDFFLQKHDPTFRGMVDDKRAAENQLRRLEGQFPSTLVMEDLSQPRQAHVLIRGEYDKPADPVQPGVPAVLPPLPDGTPANRLALAQWLVDPRHPLTARVTVNRLWQQYFGIGIVATTEDFGSQGEWPSHPQLLDWLAVELIESGWDMKAFQKRIVTSATYRQSSQAAPEMYRRDPDNRLLARGPRYRLDAETIRDQALAVSGLLVEQTGGESVKPYQPGGLWEAVGYTSSNTARFERDKGSALYRRSMYTFWKRTSPPPTMQILDAPSREVCTVRRPRTNTPAAALALMNDVQFVEASRQLAERVCREAGPEDRDRIRQAFRMATARWPDDREAAVLQEMLDAYRADYAADEVGANALLDQGESSVSSTVPAAELAAWTMICNTVLNLDEAISKR